MKILVINAGSSSLKFQLIDMDDESVKAKGLVERIGIEGTHFKQTVLGTDKVIEFTRNMKDHTEAISAVLSALTDKDNGAIASLDEIGACGHRVLHGGETFKNSVLVTEETMKGIEDLVPLGPLHQPANIAGIKACQAVMPAKPNVAVFDTAFHQTMPKKACLLYTSERDAGCVYARLHRAEPAHPAGEHSSARDDDESGQIQLLCQLFADRF